MADGRRRSRNPVNEIFGDPLREKSKDDSDDSSLDDDTEHDRGCGKTRRHITSDL